MYGAGMGRTTSRGHARCAGRWSVPPHSRPLPWGEGEPFPPRRTIQNSRLSTERCALFPLPKGEGQGEGKHGELSPHVWDHSQNCPTRCLTASTVLTGLPLCPHRCGFGPVSSGLQVSIEAMLQGSDSYSLKSRSLPRGRSRRKRMKAS